MDQIIDFLKEFNVQNIISMGLIVWYFNRDTKASIDSLDRDVRAMNTRIGRLEGSVYGKDFYRYSEGEK